MAPNGAPLLEGGVSEFRDAVDTFRWLKGAVTRDGAFLAAPAVASERHIVHVWDAATAQLAVVLEGPQVGVRACHWHPDPARCAAWSPTACFFVSECAVIWASCG